MEDLLPSLDLLHRVGLAEEAGLGFVEVPILHDDAAGSYEKEGRQAFYNMTQEMWPEKKVLGKIQVCRR